MPLLLDHLPLSADEAAPLGWQVVLANPSSCYGFPRREASGLGKGRREPSGCDLILRARARRHSARHPARRRALPSRSYCLRASPDRPEEA